MASRRRVSGAIRSLVLQVDCARILHETLLMPFFMYGSNTMMWREKERSMKLFTNQVLGLSCKRSVAMLFLDGMCVLEYLRNICLLDLI